MYTQVSSKTLILFGSQTSSSIHAAQDRLRWTELPHPSRLRFRDVKWSTLQSNVTFDGGYPASSLRLRLGRTVILVRVPNCMSLRQFLHTHTDCSKGRGGTKSTSISALAAEYLPSCKAGSFCPCLKCGCSYWPYTAAHAPSFAGNLEFLMLQGCFRTDRIQLARLVKQ